MAQNIFDGLRVIDCASYIAAPAAASVLAEYGADVVKIEPPGGDPYRKRTFVPASGYIHPANPGFMLDGRNRRSVVLDLRRPAGRAALRRLVTTADVFITNAPLDVRRKLGITYAELGPLNARLIYASLTGYGEIGPEAEMPGFDATAWWARSGMMHLMRAGDAAPVRSLSGMGDHPSAMALYAAIATALYRRERTGKGLAVGSSLLANGLWANACQVQARLLGEAIAPAPPREQMPYPLRNHYRCRDGRWLILSIVPDQRRWVALRTALGSALLESASFDTLEARNQNARALTEALDRIFAQRDRADWCAILEPTGLVFGLVAEMDGIPDAQTLASGVLADFSDGVRTVNSPFWIEGHDKTAPEHAPQVGAHSGEVLRAAGYSDAEITAMREEGVTV